MNLLRYIGYIALKVVIALLLAVPAEADTDRAFDTFTLYYENDFLFGTDRDYTSGLKLTWSTPYTREASEERSPAWAYSLMSRLPMVNDPATQRAISLSIGQDIYTPEDKDRAELIVDDRPYAGRTYVAIGFHSKTARRQHSWEVNVGIVGPASMAEDAQKLFHKINGATDPQGWDNQLDNEITFDAIYETQWKLGEPRFPQRFSYDVIPHLGGRLGTASTYINGGGELRFGWGMPEDFGTCPIRSGCEVNSAFEKGVATRLLEKVGTHFFVAADGRMVLRDIYLDGNTFRDSHSVEKKLFVADLIAGISARYGNIKATYSFIYRTKQFEVQEDAQAFSSFSVSWTY